MIVDIDAKLGARTDECTIKGRVTDECESQNLQDEQLVDENEGQAANLPELELDKSPSTAGLVAQVVSEPMGEHAQSVLGGSNAAMPSHIPVGSHDKEPSTSIPGLPHGVSQHDPPHAKVSPLSQTSECPSKVNISQHTCPSASASGASKKASNVSKVVEEVSSGNSILQRARPSTRGVTGSKKRYRAKSPQPQLSDYFCKAGKEEK